jgi:DNA invertase Pin-like site-specific DNA recombinase
MYLKHLISVHARIICLVMRTPAKRRVALYTRVSTDQQVTANQELELRSVALRNGWDVVESFCDAGISGAKGRDQRPGLDRLMKGVARKDFDIVAAWSVDRLGRSLQNLVSFLADLHSKGIDLYLHQQGVDTTTPSGRAMFQMIGVFAEFERSMIRERVSAGLRRAKAQGKKLGRPTISIQKAAAIRSALKEGKHGIRKIAASLKTGVGTVQRIKAELSAGAH